MNEFIERLSIDGQTLWTFVGEVQPASFIADHLRRRGLKRHEVNTRMRWWRAKVRRRVAVPVVAITHGERIVGLRVSTWRGTLQAPLREACSFLRREGFSPVEVRTLQALARRERIKSLSLLAAQ